jgi:hypothetical protein
MFYAAFMMNTGEPDATESGHVRFGKGSLEKELPPRSHLAGDLLHVTYGSEMKLQSEWAGDSSPAEPGLAWVDVQAVAVSST